MFKRILTYTMLLMCSIMASPVFSQQDPKCTFVEKKIVKGEVFFNFGSTTDAYSFRNRSSVSLGEPLVGTGISKNNTTQIGFWSRFLIPPLAPIVTATQGELQDRIQVSWEINPLGSQATEGFKLYRDGVYLASVDRKIRNFNDFNVIAGRPYNYEVRGINSYGDGSPGKALGFQVPNGVVTGWVQTLNGNPVPNTLVTLMPMQGFSAKFGATDGAFTDTTGSNLPSMLPSPGDPWSVAFWVKTQSAGANAGILQFQPYALNIRPINSSSGQEGISIDNGGAPFLTGNFPAATKNDWHHVALAFDGVQYRLYIDGALSALSPQGNIPLAIDLNLGSRTNSAGTWEGRLDELRIYHKVLDELDLGEVMEGTASSLTPGLQFYWKMDEERGTKSFDLIHRSKIYFCGTTFDKDRPPVRTAGITNDDGYYRIESANYGTGTTFLAEPMKSFYLHRALKFARAMSNYAILPDFSLSKKATLEMWVNSAGPDGTQCLLSKKWSTNDFRLLLSPNGTNNDVKLYLNGTEHNFGLLGMGYQHLAFTIDSSGTNRTVTAYKNGVAMGAPFTFTGITGNWSDTTKVWMAGARPSGSSQTDYFGGLIDEIAIYDTTLLQDTIISHFHKSRDAQERGLRIYFPFDEGSGNRLNNLGSELTVSGKSFGTSWTPFAPNQKATPHVFTPKTRQVTLNPSNTSVDQVDFTDRSTVAVSGFVRYKGSDCFAENVEILVNGESFKPKIFTDSVGRFVVDFDPGTTATLSPKFEDHDFTPAFWDLTNVISPIAGILFTDVTTRKVKGQVAGGKCKKSIIQKPGTPSGTVCTVKVRSTDGCLERLFTIDNPEGNYEFTNLPPIEMTVAVVEHSDPKIKTAFQVQGGSTVDLSKKDTIVDFTYFAPPEVEIVSGLDPVSPTCPTIVLNQGDKPIVTIKVKEQYVVTKDNAGMVLDDGVCYLDTAKLRIINGFNEELKDTTLSKKQLKYKFTVGNPNPSPPYLQTFQVIATTLSGNETSKTVQGVVTGLKKKANTFTSTMPETPTLILRDPPGDGSYAYLEKGQQICRTVSTIFETDLGGGGGVEFHLGGNVEIAVGVGVSTIMNAGPIFDIGTEVTTTYEKLDNSTFQTCSSYSETISTSEDELVVGEQGGDVFVGNAMNIEFGFADMVEFNPATCQANVKVVLNVEPGGYATNFIYSEWGIKTRVMRYLDSLATNPGTSAADKAKYLESKNRWQTILDNNKKQKEDAKFSKNISFDAGASYEYSSTSDTSNTTETGGIHHTEGEAVTHFGFEFNKAGVVGTAKFVYSINKGEVTENGTDKGVTVGYVLKDNDPGDAFTIDVATDAVYKTPVFRTKSGQSSCPWEPRTAHRHGNSLKLRDGSSALAIDVPSTEPAVYKFTLGNNSETNETFPYAFTISPESNPHGAKVFLNGAALDHDVMYGIPYGTSVPITLTIERGPIEYNYDSIEVVFYSLCEADRADALGLPPENDKILYHSIFVSAHFIQPCSEVEVNVPEQDWVIFPDPKTPGNDDIMRITVSGYDRSQADFDRVRLQYRRSDGDGAWINIVPPDDPIIKAIQPGAEITKANLGVEFTQFYWDTYGLSDGPYEIRAVAVCTGDPSDKPGYSHIIKGRIDRQPPSIVGTPEPSDGVFNVGDEISFTFNQPVNCNKLIEATGLPTIVKNNVGLFDATTGKVIDVDISCYENKITMVPKFQNEFFENKILRAELHGIQDLTGNTFDGTRLNGGVWEFFVDRNELAWLTDSMGMTKYEDQTKTVTVSIHNRGGAPVPFTIKGVPSWVRVVPDKGTLVPNEIRPISFEVDSTLGFGRWSDTIILHTETGQNPFFMGGDEALPIGVRVVCRPPNWDLKAGLYQNTMNMVLELNIQGTVSKDVEDIVAAYIGDELRGIAHVQYAPQVGKYLAYMTVYGNPSDMTPLPKPVRFEIWDASACLRFGEVVESLTFQADNVIGTSGAPQVLHTNSLVLREVPFAFGWNWLSFNLAFPNNSLDAALSSLQYPANDLIRSQTQFSEYGGGWFGSLNNLSNTTMYIYRADLPDTLKMLGNSLDPATTPIPLVHGWNWIGYVPSYSLPINEALKSLPSLAGDIIKSQFAFAQYFSKDFGWVGNLKYMEPPLGYQIKVDVPGTLIYPPPSPHRPSDEVESRGGPVTESPNTPTASFWTVNPVLYEHSMTLIGMLKANDANATASGMELGVFAGSELRGSTQAIYIAPLNAYLFFLTTYANESGEPLKFKLFNTATGVVQDLAETMWFSSNLHQGSIEAPVPFTLKTSGTVEAPTEQYFDVQPNPFRDETVFRFVLQQAEEVTLSVVDMRGREVSRLRSQVRAGLNTVTWDGTSESGLKLGAGVYFVRLNTQTGMMTRKVVLQR